MAYSKIAMHIAPTCGGCDGIDGMWAAMQAAGVPFTVSSVDDGGLLAKATQYPLATLVYRDTEASTLDPYSYNNSPATEAGFYWNTYLSRLPVEVYAQRDRVWIEVLNEPGKDDGQANWVGWFMFYTAQLALAQGWRICGPGWSPGTPEPEHWEQPGWIAYLKLCEQHPDRVAVSVHEYSINNDIHSGENWHINRLRFIFDACDAHEIAYPKVFVTECGWTYNSMPDDLQAIEDIKYLAALYASYPTVVSAHLWTLQSGKGNGDLPERLNALIPWLTQYNITARFPDPEPPPDNGEDGMNYLQNGSFEEPWTDATNFPGQHPQDWYVSYKTGPLFPNPFGGQPYKVGEAVHKTKAMFPPAEQDVFVWDGNTCFKVFGGGDKSFWAVMEQDVTLLPGKYMLSLGIWVDHYHWNGYKDYDVDPNQAQVRVLGNNATLRPWLSLKAGEKATVLTEITHSGGTIHLAVELRSNWDINGNFFLDGWKLEALGVEPEPEPQPGYLAVVIKYPQDITPYELLQVAAVAHPNLRDMSGSKDSALNLLKMSNNPDSYIQLAFPDRDHEDFLEMLAEAGYRWEALEIPANILPPFTG